MAPAPPRAEERIEGLTVAQAVERLERSGFGAQFGARAGGAVMCFTCRAEVDAGEVPLRRALRVEGPSDPAGEAVIAGVLCPRCQARGTLVLTFGPAGAPEDAAVFGALRDERAVAGAAGRGGAG